MCGINGKISLRGFPIFASEIEAMNGAIKHRGPDDSGVWLDGSVGLGNVRLSIIDLSPKGHMPMKSLDGDLVITFNGEIYNYKENRRLLESRGYNFFSTTDTETVLYLYQEFGINCLKYLKGMFAFAIWDRPRHRLFAARDHFGKKPLKYFLNDKIFVFSSEIKGILANPEVPRQIDDYAIDAFMSLRYVPNPLTGFAGIQKLPQGSFLIFENNQLKIEKYYQPDLSAWETHPKSFWVEALRQTLDDAVKARVLASDVPVGSFLSGGFDSSVVSAIASRHTRLQTFSVGYEGSLKENELPYARIVADHIHSDHHELIIKPNIAEDLPSIIKFYEEPFGDPAMLPTFYLAQAVASKLKVVLTGDGGDETFLGYGKSFNYFKYSFYFLLSREIRNILANLPWSARVKFILDSMKGSPPQAFLTNCGCWDRAIDCRYHFDKLFLYDRWYFDKTAGDLAYGIVRKAFFKGRNYHPLNQAALFDFESYLPDNNLPKIDLGFMANSLEGRSPLLDIDLVNLACRIPPLLRANKKMFKEAFSDLLPQSIVTRRKQGFSVPLNKWFRGEMKDFLWSELLDDSFVNRGWFKKESLEILLRKQLKGDNNYDNHLWCLLSLSQWLKVWSF